MHTTLVTTLMRLGALRHTLDRVRARAKSARHANDADATALVQMRLQRLILMLNRRLADLTARRDASKRRRSTARRGLSFNQPAFAALPVRTVRSTR